MFAGGTLAICLLSILNKHKVPVQKNLHAPLPQDYACDVPSLPSRGIASKPEDAVTTPVPVSWLDGAILVARTDEARTLQTCLSLPRCTGFVAHCNVDVPYKIGPSAGMPREIAVNVLSGHESLLKLKHEHAGRTHRGWITTSATSRTSFTRLARRTN